METDDSIEIIDYFMVLCKWKWFITLFTLIFLLAAVIVNMSMADIFDVSMVVEPAVSNFDASWRPIYMDSNSDIKSKLDLGIYDKKIINSLYVDFPDKRLFKTAIPKSSNLLKISIEIRDKKRGAQVLKLLYNLLSEESKSRIEARKLQAENILHMKKTQLLNIVEEEDQLKKEIAKVSSNTKKLINERSMLIGERGGTSDKLSILIYTNTIHENIAYKNTLQKQLNEVISRAENLKPEIQNLRLKIDAIRNIKMIQPPQSSPTPVKPRRIFNTVVIFIVSLMVSLFLAFFLEYIRKVRARDA